MGWILNVSNNKNSKKLINVLQNKEVRPLILNGLDKILFNKKNKNTPSLDDDLYSISDYDQIMDILFYRPHEKRREQYSNEEWNEPNNPLKQRIQNQPESRYESEKYGNMQVNNLLSLDDDMIGFLTPDMLDPKLEDTHEIDAHQNKIDYEEKIMNRKKLDERIGKKSLLVDPSKYQEENSETKYQAGLNDDWLNFAKEYISK